MSEEAVCSESVCCDAAPFAARSQDSEHCPEGYTWDGTECVPPPRCDVTPIITFSPESGSTVLFPVEVSLACNYAVDIYYTLDGSNPTTASTKYTGPFAVDSDVVVKAIPNTECGQSVFTATYIGVDSLNLLAWYRADTLEVATGASVVTWPDSSGNGNTANTGFPARVPTMRAGPSVEFLIDGGNPQGLYTPVSVAIGGSFTIFCVLQCLNTANAARRAVQGDTSNWMIGPFTGFFQLYNGAFIAGPAIDTNKHILTTTHLGSGLAFPNPGILAKLFLDAALQGSNIPATGPGIGYNGSMQFGLSGGGSYVVEALDGKIYEVLIYSGALSDPHLAAIHNYLSVKFGITI